MSPPFAHVENGVCQEALGIPPVLARLGTEVQRHGDCPALHSEPEAPLGEQSEDLESRGASLRGEPFSEPSLLLPAHTSLHSFPTALI